MKNPTRRVKRKNLVPGIMKMMMKMKMMKMNLKKMMKSKTLNKRDLIAPVAQI